MQAECKPHRAVWAATPRAVPSVYNRMRRKARGGATQVDATSSERVSGNGSRMRAFEADTGNEETSSSLKLEDDSCASAKRTASP